MTTITYKRTTSLYPNPSIETIEYEGDPKKVPGYQLRDWIRERNKDIFLEDDEIQILFYD